MDSPAGRADLLFYAQPRGADEETLEVELSTDRGGPPWDPVGRHPLCPDEVLQQARATRGVRRCDDIGHAGLERPGTISIMSKSG